MGLYSSIQMASNSLRANSVAMQVIGQNLANANTPGYIREEVVLSPAPTQKVGGLLLGMGVQVLAVTQKIDMFLEARLRNSVSDRAGSNVTEESYQQLEGVIAELGESDLSTSMNNFFSSISEILNQPDSTSVRNLAVLEGTKLARDIRRMASRVTEMRSDLNDRVAGIGERINRLTEEITTLNIRITETEGGRVSNSDAVGLRDQRYVAMEGLAELIDVRIKEQNNGSVTIYVGGDFLVYEGVRREVEVINEAVGGFPVARVQLVETQSALEARSGELTGVIEARDSIMGDYLAKLDDFAQTLAFEFNQIFSSGQGLSGYSRLTSEFAVDDSTQPLDQAGLSFTPTNGSFIVHVYNRTTKLTRTTDIFVDLNGIGADTSLDDLAAKLDAINGISAQVTPGGQLAIQSDAADQEFGFESDSSGVLAALGVNTFFSGTSALSLGVNQVILDDPAKFAASRGGVGRDTDNAIALADLLDRPMASHNGETLEVVYERFANETAQGSAISQAIAEGNRVFESTLRGQKLAISGVSLDEEAIKLISYQRAFQASARYISVLNDLFDIMVNL